MGRTPLVVSIAVLALLTACGPPSPPVIAARSHPPSQSPSAAASVAAPVQAGFVDLDEVAPDIVQDIRYHSDHNFVGRPIDGYLQPKCVLTQRAAQALAQAQNSVRGKGFSLKVYDCYRPLRAGEDFKRWAASPGDDAMKAEFYPGLSKASVFADGYVSNGRSAHSRGSTVDLTLVALPVPAQRPFVKGEPLTPCTAPAGQRFPDNSIDMGTGYDCFDSRSHTLDARATAPARQNRLLLRQLMSDAGFRNNPSEWWHYSLNDEPFPQDYFDFPITGAASPPKR
ncbi:D-alanyl-D-alanine dipeptidase [Rhizocola hellebori]|uniref:D-alanyl-D-alanine dipeptidase n=1 Tax=Rhizocola hellebori TaxID=1392758 RepID=A0A8J3QFU1_9ACTN|nr:M15 family metallopeptidase [Rhizocola hellebori]GIH10199.1 D-alanyl-D-alanine dipeptidase [Rhizocola hellebori]